MKTCKILTSVAFICLLYTAVSCSSPENNKEQTLPPTNGEESRYNINEADTLGLPIDSNRNDTSSSRN